MSTAKAPKAVEKTGKAYSLWLKKQQQKQNKKLKFWWKCKVFAVVVTRSCLLNWPYQRLSAIATISIRCNVQQNMAHFGISVNLSHCWNENRIYDQSLHLWHNLYILGRNAKQLPALACTLVDYQAEHKSLHFFVWNNVCCLKKRGFSLKIWTLFCIVRLKKAFYIEPFCMFRASCF